MKTREAAWLTSGACLLAALYAAILILLVGIAMASVEIHQEISRANVGLDRITQEIIDRTSVPAESAKREQQPIKSNSHEGTTP
jgi:hypothetical protein